MYLYELAIELDQRSPDLAEKAEALGIGPILAATELTGEQVQALRAAYGSGGAVPVPSGGSPIGLGPQTDPTAPPPEVKASKGRAVLVVGALVLAVVGLAGFFMMKGEPDEERRKQISADLQAWQTAPPATIDPKAVEEAAAAVPADQPKDETKLCAAQDRMYDTEVRMNHADTIDPADLATWRAAVDEMAGWAPAYMKDDVIRYRDEVAKIYDLELQGADIATIQAQHQNVAAAEDVMYPRLRPFCGMPGDPGVN